MCVAVCMQHDAEPFSIEKRTDPRLGTTFEEKALKLLASLALSLTYSLFASGKVGRGAGDSPMCDQISTGWSILFLYTLIG